MEKSKLIYQTVDYTSNMILKIKNVVSTKWSSEKLCPVNDTSSIFNQTNILNNLDGLCDIFNIVYQLEDGTEINEGYANTGIVSNWIMACNCLAVSLFQPSLLFASISVECAINHDSRLQSVKNKDKNNWLNLTNNGILREAKRVGIPTSILCDEDEDINSKDPIRFVDRRNKIAHGDSLGYSKISVITKHTKGKRTSRSFIPTKEHALFQIGKSRNFILEWAKPNNVIVV